MAFTQEEENKLRKLLEIEESKLKLQQAKQAYFIDVEQSLTDLRTQEQAIRQQLETSKDLDNLKNTFQGKIEEFKNLVNK